MNRSWRAPVRNSTLLLIGLTAACLAASVSWGQMVPSIRTGPTMNLSPVPTGLGGPYGSSGLGGASSSSLGSINSLQSSLPQMDPAPTLLPELYRSTDNANAISSPVGASAFEQPPRSAAPEFAYGADNTRDDASQLAALDALPEDEGYESYDASQVVTPGSPPDDDQSDGDDTDEQEEGLSWWVWLIVAVAVAGVMAKLSD